MLTTPTSIETVEVWRHSLAAKDETIKLLEEQVQQLKEQIEWLKRQMFGRKSERYDPNQLFLDSLMLEATAQNSPTEPEELEEPEIPIEAHTRKRKSGGRNAIPDDIERVYHVIDIPEEEKVLPDGTPRPVIGHEDSERLAYIPGKFTVHVTRRIKYGSPGGAEEHGVVIAPVPERLLPRCMADETLLAHLAVAKYGDHLPIYRMEQIFKRANIDISRQTMCRWLKESGLALNLVAQEIKKRLFATGMVHFDDTPVDLLQDNRKKPRGKRISEARFWVASAAPRDGPWTVFDFTEDRSADGPLEFFKDYGGKYTCDAYPVHDKLLPQVDGKLDETRMYGCWAHTRRYFYDAHKSDAPRIGAEFVALIQELYTVEREIAESSDQERLEQRHARSKPMLEKIRAKIDALLPDALPKSKLGQALAYANKFWKRLTHFIDDPQAGIDNNPAENAIRPIALGRKNWLFIGDKEAGKAAANLMTIIGTCKKAGDNPYEYMLDVMQRLPKMKTTEIGQIIPEHWNNPVKSKQKK